MRQLSRAALLAVALYTVLSPRSYAQQCVAPATFCDALWDGATGQYIENPSCAYINHAFLQSSTILPASQASEGYVYSPNGTPCGAEENGVACGVRTTTNTCGESAPTTCATADDPLCECAGGDPACNLDPGDGGGDGGGGGDDGSGGGLSPCGDHPCADGVGPVLHTASQSSPLPGSTSSLLDELARANGIYIKANVTLPNSLGKATTATYEYWERDGRYRIRLSPGGNSPWSDIAFDGTFTQGKPAPDAVEVKRGDDRLTPLPDGPLALALAPLRINDPIACRLCQLRLADLQDAVASRHNSSPKLAAAERMIRQGTFDAGAGRTGEADAQGRLVRLVWPPDGKQHTLEVMLDNYQPIQGTTAVFPMRLVENLTPTVSIQYVVEKVELSPSFKDAEIFNIYSTAHTFFYTRVAKDGSVHTVVRKLPAAPAETTTKPAGQ
jgi:hypothetical protein